LSGFGANCFAHVTILPVKIGIWFQISVEIAKNVLIVIKNRRFGVEIDTQVPKRLVSTTLETTEYRSAKGLDLLKGEPQDVCSQTSKLRQW
jgi:hypothetical protein